MLKGIVSRVIVGSAIVGAATVFTPSVMAQEAQTTAISIDALIPQTGVTVRQLVQDVGLEMEQLTAVQIRVIGFNFSSGMIDIDLVTSAGTFQLEVPRVHEI